MTHRDELKIEVQLFAAAAELAGCRSVELSIPPGADVGLVRQQLVQRFSQLQSLAECSRWAVGVDFVADDFPVDGSQSMAMIPPVSGG